MSTRPPVPVTIGVIAVALATGFAIRTPRTENHVPRIPVLAGPPAPLHGQVGDLAGISGPVLAARAEMARIVAQQAATAARAARTTNARPVGTAAVSGRSGGSCEAMRPAGFPRSIVERESGGDPSAVNPRSGTQGCVQIDARHFSSDGFGTGQPGMCVGLSYAACWSVLYRTQGLGPWSL